MIIIPGLITHYVCGEALLNSLSDDSHKKIMLDNRQIYNIGTQGPDVFFYYLPCLYKKNLNNLGTKMHNSNVQLYMSAMIDLLVSLDKKSRDPFISYLCGYFSHYALDYNTHPYIYYKTGTRREGELSSLKYSVYHRNFETSIDTLILKAASSERPSDKKLWHLIKVGRGEVSLLSDLLSKALNQTYEISITSRQVYGAISYMYNATRFLQSKKGRRKKLMELVENITLGENVVTSVIHKQEIKDGIDYLNASKKDWYMPWDKEKKINSSFSEMFDKAIDDSKRMIAGLFAFLADDLSKDELLTIIGNYSFATGLDCNEKVDFTHFDIVYA